MHQGCAVLELDIVSSNPTHDFPLQSLSEMQYSVNVKAWYHHNISCPEAIDDTNVHLLYGIAVIHSTVGAATHSIDASKAIVDSNAGGSNLVLAACYFYDNLIEVLRVHLQGRAPVGV